MVMIPKDVPNSIKCPECIGWGTLITIAKNNFESDYNTNIKFKLENCKKCSKTGRRAIPETELN